MYDDKENTAPIVLQHGNDALFLSPQKSDKRARSKSMGPATDDNTTIQIQAQVTPTRGILPSQSDEERRAARRKSMANRRVSFAPEATLHTWDVIEYMRDHTVSTEAESTQRTPRLNQSPRQMQDPSSPFDSDPEEEEEDGSSDDGESEDEDEDASEAMSMVSADVTQTSGSESSSTSSSAQLERNLRMAAEIAGTKGIEFDEFGDMTMEMAQDEVTNAFQPWVRQEDERRGSATYDQENIDPFQEQKNLYERQQDEDNVSMDVTRAVGTISEKQSTVPESSPFGDATMDMTQGVGLIKSNLSPSSKRKYDQSPTVRSPLRRSKRRRSTASISDDRASESGDATMELTRAVGQIHSSSRFSGESFDPNEEMSMELTAVLGGIHLPVVRDVPQASSAQRVSKSPMKRQSGMPSPSPRADSRLQDKVADNVDNNSTKRRSSARIRNSVLSTPEKHTTPSTTPKSSSGKRRGIVQSPGIHASPTPAKRNTTSVSPRVVPATPTPSTPRGRDSPKDVKAAAGSVKAQARSPATGPVPRSRSTPPSAKTSSQPLAETIKLMTTPRKEGLKSMSPKKIVSATRSPAKRTPSKRSIPMKQIPLLSETKSPSRQLMDEFTKLQPTSNNDSHIHLQQFLDEAGIRFMDLTTSKRRHTAVRTPKKQVADDEDDPSSQTVSLEEAIVAAACSEPELELYKHACHELNRYIEEGRSDMKALEAETYKRTPALIQAYMSAEIDRRASLDGQLRDIKSNARLRSREMWYGWRSTLVDDLMHVLQGIAEGLLTDDDVLTEKEGVMARTMPSLLEQRNALRREVDGLRRATIVVPDDEKDDLNAAREQLLAMNQELQTRRAEQHELQCSSDAMGSQLDSMRDNRDRLTTAIEQAESRIEASRSGSTATVNDLRATITEFEREHGWKIVSAASSASLTMRYKSEIELIFQPARFANAGVQDGPMSNAPIKLSYCGSNISTIQRFFLQSLQAYLQAIPQRSTLVASMLQTIGEVWTASMEIGRSERSLRIEGHVDISIRSDECLAVTTMIILPRIKTKVKVTFLASVMVDDDLSIDISTTSDVEVVYGTVPKLDSIKDSLNSYARQGADTWQRGLQWLQTEMMNGK